MAKDGGANVEKFVEAFSLLEQGVTDVHNKNNSLEAMLEDVNRQMNFLMTKEKSLIEERDCLQDTVNSLQQTLQEQMDLKVENEQLKNNLMELKQQNERTVQDGESELQRLLEEMRAEADKHQGELETLRQQSRRELEDAQREALNKIEAKETEVKGLLEKKDLDLEEMKKKLKEQERDRQSHILKLQIEFGAKLARVQSSAQLSQQQQQQQHSSSLLPQSVFKRRLQFIQEEKNREIEALRQRIKELEANQCAGGFSVNPLKRKKVQFERC